MLPAGFRLFIIVIINLQVTESLPKFEQKSGNAVTMAEKDNLKYI